MELYNLAQGFTKVMLRLKPRNLGLGSLDQLQELLGSCALLTWHGWCLELPQFATSVATERVAIECVYRCVCVCQITHTASYFSI